MNLCAMDLDNFIEIDSDHKLTKQSTCKTKICVPRIVYPNAKYIICYLWQKPQEFQVLKDIQLRTSFGHQKFLLRTFLISVAYTIIILVSKMTQIYNYSNISRNVHNFKFFYYNLLQTLYTCLEQFIFISLPFKLIQILSVQNLKKYVC